MSSPFKRIHSGSSDANEQARLVVAQQQFAQQVAAGHLGPRDSFARPISTRDYVTWHPAHGIVWVVDAITPVLEPSAPPGMVEVSLRTTGRFRALANNVLPILTKLGIREQAAEAAQEAPPDGPPADP